ncbi:MAG TPA: hypothetical protein VKH81_04775 [Candidatus Angelobacter sp.]|nr:hypothetical protein [Candidatus Angelobacter sp.]
MLAAVIFWRRLQRKFPLFLVYVLTAFFVGVIRFVVYKLCSSLVYLYVFWASDVVVVLAALLAIYETFLRRIFPGFAAVRFYRYLFPAAAVIIAILGFLSAVRSHDTRTAFYMTTRVLDFIRSAVIGFFVAVILLMGRQFSGYEFSIAAGFGIQSAVALANAAIRMQMHYASTPLDRFEPVAFDAACLIWLWTFANKKNLPQPQSTAVLLDPDALHQARRWEDVLKDFLTPGKRL